MEKNLGEVKLEILIVVLLKYPAFFNSVPYRPGNSYSHFERSGYLHLCGRSAQKVSSWHAI